MHERKGLHHFNKRCRGGTQGRQSEREKKKHMEAQWGKHSLEGSTSSCQSQAPLVHQGHSQGGSHCMGKAAVKWLDVTLAAAGIKQHKSLRSLILPAEIRHFYWSSIKEIIIWAAGSGLKHASSWRTNSSVFFFGFCIHIFLGARVICFLPLFLGWKSFLARVHPRTFHCEELMCSVEPRS